MPETTQDDVHDIAIIGAGASGTALFYTLARYSTARRIVLIEKYSRAGQVNSKASNNSQTLHVGDIETNYSLEKVRQVHPAAMMVAQYAQALPDAHRSAILFPTPKMVLGVGEAEVVSLRKRYDDLRSVFPSLRLLEREEIERVEPMVVKGRPKNQAIVALYTTQGYAVDFEKLSESFIESALAVHARARVTFDSEVSRMSLRDDGAYEILLATGETVVAKAVVVDADSYSLLMAKQLGYGRQYSLIPIAGTFYFSRKLLNGKVYTVQEPKLPFAAVHGDPDVHRPGQTRWGPTARFHPVLESFKYGTSWDYLRSSGLQKLRTWISFAVILLDPVRLGYLLKNMLYELPWVGRSLFIHNAKKIVPTIRAQDIHVAQGFGGMRLQRVDTVKRELQLGEGKIIGKNIIFNMTPSPGASVCLYNAMRDAEQLGSFLGAGYAFDKRQMECDLIEGLCVEGETTSLPEGYAS